MDPKSFIKYSSWLLKIWFRSWYSQTIVQYFIVGFTFHDIMSSPMILQDVHLWNLRCIFDDYTMKKFFDTRHMILKHFLEPFKIIFLRRKIGKGEYKFKKWYDSGSRVICYAYCTHHIHTMCVLALFS